MHAFVKFFLAAFFLLALGACGAGGAPSRTSGDGGSVSPAPSPAPVVLDQLTVLVVGQSISSNCNEHKFGPVSGVFQIGRDGTVKAAEDPFEWADCSNGSMWMPLGKLLIDGGVTKKAVFMPIGVGGTKVSDWQAGGAAYAKLNTAIAQIKEKKIRFDFIFWHQGSSDIGTAPNEYLNRLTAVADYINANVEAKRWLVALHSRCSGQYDAAIENAQRQFINVEGKNRYLGPNTNSLDNSYRIDGCHLTQQGQEKMASMWYSSIRTALGYK
jgi:hypothetical protein